VHIAEVIHLDLIQLLVVRLDIRTCVEALLILVID